VISLLLVLGGALIWQLGGVRSGRRAPSSEATMRLILEEVDAAITSRLVSANPWLTKRWLHREVQQLLSLDGSLELVEEGASPEGDADEVALYRLRLRFVLEEAPAEGLAFDPSAPESVVRLTTSAALQRLFAPGTGDVFEARSLQEERVSPLPGKEGLLPREVFSRLVGKGVAGVLSQTREEALLVRQPTALLLTAAGEGEVRRRVAALRTLGSRPEAEVLPALVGALRDDNHDIVLAAVGALVERRDPAAVGPLIDSTRGRGLDYLNQVLYAVASLGGQEAEAYLDTLLHGHQDAEIRTRAGEAIAELQSRKTKLEAARAAAPAPGGRPPVVDP